MVSRRKVFPREGPFCLPQRTGAGNLAFRPLAGRFAARYSVHMHGGTVRPGRAHGGMGLPLVMTVTVLVYAVLYAPQPLLPLFARRFTTSESAAALLVTTALLPLSVAPLLYGYLLESVSPARLLRASVLGLGTLELGFALADSFPLLLALRLGQGLLLPAALTALMTHIAASAREGRLQRAMSSYVAATIVGGYLGRLLSGTGAAYLHWRAPFALLGASLLLCGFLLRGVPVEARVQPLRTQPRLVLEVLGDRTSAAMYATAFCIFFVFAGLLNFVPFRLAELHPGPAGAWSGFIYTGYLLGVVTALGSQRLAGWMGGEGAALVAGFAAYLGALTLTLVPHLWTFFGALSGFCAAMFLVHAVAAGVVNRRAERGHGIVNGLYLVAYYSGGALGSYLPGLVYERAGWRPFVFVLLAVATAGLGVALAFRRVEGREQRGLY
jgi:YNFM family putative membrane transporter